MVKRLSFRVILSAIAVLVVMSCRKEQIGPTQPVVTPIVYIPTGSNMNAPSVLMDTTWKCTLVGYPSLRFGSDGSFGTGTWRMRQPDSIRAVTMFPQDWRIIKCTADTLKLINVGMSITTYTH